MLQMCKTCVNNNFFRYLYYNYIYYLYYQVISCDASSLLEIFFKSYQSILKYSQLALKLKNKKTLRGSPWVIFLPLNFTRDQFTLIFKPKELNVICRACNLQFAMLCVCKIERIYMRVQCYPLNCWVDSGVRQIQRVKHVMCQVCRKGVWWELVNQQIGGK